MAGSPGRSSSERQLSDHSSQRHRRGSTQTSCCTSEPMNTATSIAVLLLITGGLGWAYYVFVSRARKSGTLSWLAVVSVMAAGVSMWLVDVNGPFELSHWRPGGEPVSLPVALLAYMGRSAALCALAFIPKPYAILRAR